MTRGEFDAALLAYAVERRNTLAAQVKADRRKLAKFERTGEPAWLAKPGLMFKHRLNCHLREAELIWFCAEIDKQA